MMVLSSSRWRRRYVQCRRRSSFLLVVGSFLPAAVLAECRAACGATASPDVVVAFVNSSPPVSSTPPISRKLLRYSSRRPSSSSWCIAGAVAGHGTKHLPGSVFDTPLLPPPSSSSVVALSATSPGGGNVGGRPPSPVAAVAFLAIAVSYWYLLVLGAAAAASNHWSVPVPDFIPLTPGWPPTDADLAPALEDSAHFFYIRDLLDHFSEGGSSSTPPPPPALRLALFNIAEAWVFAFLPVLLTDDRRRLPTPVVWFTWLGALGLTNAFLAPYLAAREIRPLLLGAADDDGTTASGRMRSAGERALSASVGIVAAAVVTYALAQTLNVILAEGAAGQIEALRTLIVSDRTYLAFCVDLVLFAAFQAWLMRDVVVAAEASRNGVEVDGSVGEKKDDWTFSVPLIGLLAWLFRSDARGSRS